MIIGIFLSYAQNVGFDVRKKMYKLPEMGWGGGEVIRAMPERKHSFFQEVFPYFGKQQIQHNPRPINLN